MAAATAEIISMPTTHKIRQERSSGSASSPMPASPRRSGRVQVRSRRSDRSTQLRRKPSSFPDWSVDNRDGHVRIATFAGGRSRMKAARALFIWHGAEGTPEGRSLQLLREWLSPAQREQFARKGYFEVVGSDSGIRYRIHAGGLGQRVRDRRERSPTGGAVFHAHRRSADRRRHARPKRSRWKHARVRFALWPGGSHPTVSISGKHGLSGKPNLAQTGAEPR